MAGQLLSSGVLDADGRQPVLNDSILSTYYYSTEGETWDMVAVGGQSWASEVYYPSDPFEQAQLSSDRWALIAESDHGGTSVVQGGGLLTATVTKDEGISGLSSGGKWTLSGDFEIRLYIDWDSYYNEYRSIAHTFFKVGYDGSNAARIAFTFDGEGYVFSSEKTVGRSLTYFDWQDNGSLLSVASISTAATYAYLKIVRTAGVVKTYISTGAVDTQVGEDLSDAIFSEDLFVEFGVETKEYNTYSSAFTKFFVRSGTLTQATEFFSPERGRLAAFPSAVIIATDVLSISLIDAGTSKLWMRFLVGPESPIIATPTSVAMCNGTLYCATAEGLVAFDFHRDKIYKYVGGSLYVADEPLSLRNSEVSFTILTEVFGTPPSDNIQYVAAHMLGGVEYVVIAHNAGVSIFRAREAGVANCTDGPLPAGKISIADNRVLMWVGYNPGTGAGELSYYSDLTAATFVGTTSFSRSGYYGVATTPALSSVRILSLDARAVGESTIVAVGTTEGVDVLWAGFGGGAKSYGVASTENNPVLDPSFEGYLGIYWRVGYNGLHNKFFATRETTFVEDGTYSLKMRYDSPVLPQYLVEDSAGWVYQDVDFTDVSRLYFDCLLTDPILFRTTNVWDFEVLVDDQLLKAYQDIEGPIVKYADSIDVEAFTGEHRLVFRIRLKGDVSSGVSISTRSVHIDNIRTSIGNPDFCIIPEGNAAVLEVLVQYDTLQKVYFATAGGYGAIDFSDNQLDYFIPITQYVPGAEVVSADFTRTDTDVV